MPELGPRGEGWVIGQVVLVALWLFAPRFESRWPHPLSGIARLLGLVLAALGAGYFGNGLLCLGSSLTPYPRPKPEAVLVTGGVYRQVRHPIYAGITLLLLGLGMMSGNLARVVLAAAGLFFFDRKGTLEERWLEERFPDYPAYRERVPARLLPGIR
jgi:protein-S-isoprenylcysteine O-methyltransferase Ste14